MLSTNSTSSIQKRRQQHRRQQSLDVPILATPIPVNPRRNLRAQPAHRRGLSLDQSLSALSSPTGFRPLLPQEQPSPASSHPTVSLKDTNTGQTPSKVQHQVQETQLHQPSQPGYLAQDFSSHLQQQLNGGTQSQPPPMPFQPHQQRLHIPNPLQAAEDLQNHIEWFKKMYGSSPVHELPTTPTINVTQLDGANQPIMPPPQHFQASHGRTQSLPQTPAGYSHPQTMPNTPQAFTQCWPSPPPTNAKHARSQSFQLDIAPMPQSFETAALLRDDQNSLIQSFFPEQTAGASDHGYASSAYSSSHADPSSPPRQHHTPMPTLFEEETIPISSMLPHGGTLAEDSMLLHATAGSADDFAYHNFLDLPRAMSPRQAMLDSLNIDASINETGVSPEEVAQFISEQDPIDSKWTCLFKGCNKKFGRKENIRSHVQTHLGDRQFRCNVCKKCFVRQHDLKRHAKIHSGERDCECPCGQSFARADALTRHRQRGMCTGALPGFEKREGEAPKRGRPKKHRPGMEERMDKAHRARQIDAALAAVEGSHASNMSSSSGLSDRSGPITPPDSSDFSHDTPLEHLLEMDQQNFDFSSWGHDTPPTSPFTGSSPAKTAGSCGPQLHMSEEGISPAALQVTSSICVDGFTAFQEPEYNPQMDFRDYLNEWLAQN